MSIVSGIVLFAVIWFLVLFVVLPIRMETQGDAGKRLIGTSAGSPSSAFSMKKKAKLTTIWAAIVWVVLTSIILWGGISVRDVDFFNRMDTEQAG